MAHTTSLQIYTPIQKTDTVFTTILSNLYKDDEFKKNIMRLEGGTEREQKKAAIIKKTVSKIRVYGNAEQPLLMARDVGILMGISHIKLQLKYYNTAERVIGLYLHNNGKTTSQVEFLTWKGFIRVASNSRSILSDLFREFIYELVAEAIGDHSLLDKITKKVVEKNPDLVDKALDELDRNVDHYKILYERELIKRTSLEEGLANEIQQRLIAERKQADAELDAILKDYKVKQMEKYMESYERALLDLRDHPQTNDQELHILRKKYMKPIYIYVPASNTYQEWTTKKDNSIVEFTQYIPEYSDRIEYIVKRYKNFVQDTPNVTNLIDTTMQCILPEMDHFYYYLHFGAMSITQKHQCPMEGFIHVATEWVTDRKHFDAALEELLNDCEKVFIKKRAILYCSIEDIRLVISQKLLELEK